jgi:hypothetical protein
MLQEVIREAGVPMSGAPAFLYLEKPRRRSAPLDNTGSHLPGGPDVPGAGGKPKNPGPFAHLLKMVEITHAIRVLVFLSFH